MNNIRERILAAALSMLAIQGTAFAQSSANFGWYVGGAIGKSNIKPDIDLSDFSAMTTQDKSSTGYKILLGHQINPSLGIEAQYQNLGKYKFIEPGVGGVLVKDSGVSLAAVGFLPLMKDFSLIGKAGIAVRKLKAELIDLGVTETDSKTKSALMLGFGVEYSISPALSVRAEYEYFGNPKFDDTKIKGDLLSVGLRYRF